MHTAPSEPSLGPKLVPGGFPTARLARPWNSGCIPELTRFKMKAMWSSGPGNMTLSFHGTKIGTEQKLLQGMLVKGDEPGTGQRWMQGSVRNG